MPSYTAKIEPLQEPPCNRIQSVTMNQTDPCPDLIWAEPWKLMKNWPSETPLLFLGGRGRYAMIAIDFFQVPPEEVMSKPLQATSQRSPGDPFSTGYWGLLSYDQFCDPVSEHHPAKEAITYRVNQIILFDQKAKKLCLTKLRKPACDHRLLSPHYRLTRDKLKSLIIDSESIRAGALSPAELVPASSDEQYLRDCENAVNDIKDGRFCQINLLRYFGFSRPFSRAELIDRIQRWGGPFSAYWQTHTNCLASFSPEQFIELYPDQGSLKALTRPIKGTIARGLTPDSDAFQIETLLRSKKDRKELHIIVDLMRNDLNRISQKGSVNVLSAGEVHTFPSVHHLVAKIQSEVPVTTRLINFFSKVCPGGSITGAPKKEVMKAIAEYEKRNRGYFMGNIFCLDDSGHLNSSILIRTMFSDQKTGNDCFQFEYAAGSGITINSIPREELKEIRTKCKPVTAE